MPNNFSLIEKKLIENVLHTVSSGVIEVVVGKEAFFDLHMESFSVASNFAGVGELALSGGGGEEKSRKFHFLKSAIVKIRKIFQIAR